MIITNIFQRGSRASMCLITKPKIRVTFSYIEFCVSYRDCTRNTIHAIDCISITDIYSIGASTRWTNYKLPSTVPIWRHRVRHTALEITEWICPMAIHIFIAMRIILQWSSFASALETSFSVSVTRSHVRNIPSRSMSLEQPCSKGYIRWVVCPTH